VVWIVLLVLVIGTVCLLRVESVSVWLRAPKPQTDVGVGVAHAFSCAISSCGSNSKTSGESEVFRNDIGSVGTTRVSNRTILPGELPGYNDGRAQRLPSHITLKLCT
jgi:hypothetical protein